MAILLILLWDRFLIKLTWLQLLLLFLLLLGLWWFLQKFLQIKVNSVFRELLLVECLSLSEEVLEFLVSGVVVEDPTTRVLFFAIWWESHWVTLEFLKNIINRDTLIHPTPQRLCLLHILTMNLCRLRKVQKLRQVIHLGIRCPLHLIVIKSKPQIPLCDDPILGTPCRLQHWFVKADFSLGCVF